MRRRRRALRAAAVPLLTGVTGLLVLAACSHDEAAPTMTSAVEAVPLRLVGGQTLEIQLAGRQPASGACDRLPAGEQLRIRDGDLTVSVPEAVPALAGGAVRIVPHTKASYVVAPDGQASAWLDGTLAAGDEADVAGFVGVDLSRTSPVGAARAVTWLARTLDDAGAYAAVLRGPAGAPDAAGATWSAAGVTADGRLVTARSTNAGTTDVHIGPSPDPCAYRETAS